MENNDLNFKPEEKTTKTGEEHLNIGGNATPSFNGEERKLNNVIKKLYSKPPLLIASVVILAVAIFLLFNRSIVIDEFKKVLNSLGVYTEVVKNVEITSTDYSEPGSWHIDKSVKWIEAGKAQITFDLNTVIKDKEDKDKDVILVLDISGSMSGDKMEKAKSNSIELVNYLLSNPSNRVALITFESDSTILSSFSNDKDELVDKLRSITTLGCTNYNAALLNVESVMSGYTKEKNRDVVTLFLTDGYPNEDTPNQVGTYDILKDKYPYMAINGVQYEMGTDIIDEIKQITDAQWVADQSILGNVLFESAVTPLVYENFVVSDYIENEYFYVNSVDDIDVSQGTAKLEDENGIQEVVWDLGDSFATGSSAQMNINVTLKEEYLGTSKFLPTNKKESISYKIENEKQKEVNSNETPVLKHSYEVHYDTNAPDGCKLTTFPKEKHYVYENVTKRNDQLTCPGYLFKGWEIDGNDEKDIQKVNDDVFIMPDHDVTIRATWSRQSIDKSMEGTVYEKLTLYKVLQKEAESGGLAKEYTGAHQDSISGDGTEKIYHWYAENDDEGTEIQNKNNVIFAGFCWQMIRTTDTGGVKMIYNGEPDANGKCGTDRGTHVGYAAPSSGTTQNLASTYYYGTSYTYNSSTKKFSLDGTKTSATWNATTGPTLVGKYTCMSNNQYATCDTLYLIESYNDATTAYVLPLNSSAHYSQIGALPFNNIYTSPSYVGYMYNKVYTYQLKDIKSTNYKYAKGFTYSNGTYKLNDGVTSISASTSMNASVFNNAHYTCFNTTGECTTLSYIYYVSSTNVYYIDLTGGENIETALDNMLKTDNVNTTNSNIKTAVDAWYEKNLINYTKYLEDTIYCNNRSIGTLNGWDPNGGDVTKYLYFKEYSSMNDLSCENVTDRFSVSNSKAKLKYPVGLMTSTEMNLLNNAYARKTGQNYWLASPFYFRVNYAHVHFVSSAGSISNYSVHFARGLRLAVSLASGTEFSDGDGSMDHPYIVDYD